MTRACYNAARDMPGLPLRILSTAAMVLLACIALAAVRSYWVEDHVGRSRLRALYLTSSEGRLRVQYVDLPHDSKRGWFHEQSEPLGGIDGVADNGVLYHFRAAGLHVGRAAPVSRPNTGTSHVARTWWLVMPYLQLAAVAAMFPVVRVLMVLHVRYRQRRGQCQQCGYDLRSTPDRCPECGMVAAVEREAVRRVKRPMTTVAVCLVILCFGSILMARPVARRTPPIALDENPLSRRLGQATDDPLLARKLHRYQLWDTCVAGVESARLAELWASDAQAFRLFSNAAWIDPYDTAAARGAARTAPRLVNRHASEEMRRRIIREALTYRFDQAVADARLALAERRLTDATSGIEAAVVALEARPHYYTAEELAVMRDQVRRAQSDLEQAKANLKEERSR
jgi:hypothetical protein